MGNCSSAPRLKANLRAFIAANPSQEGYGDDWYFETMNVLLDRWTYSHVQFLRKKFLEATGDKSEKELDKKGFFKLFAELQDMPKSVAESAFRMFDTDNSGKLNFREFCCALALCCHLMSSDDEKIRFVFDMFDTNDDGLLSANDVQTLLEYAFVKDDPSRLEGLAGDGDKDGSTLAKKQQGVLDMKQELLGASQFLTFEHFRQWALKNIDNLTNLLHTFQIVPSPERERLICEEILSRHQTLQEGGTWYCLSHKWLQVWKAHANWRGPSPGRRAAGSSSTGHGLLVVQASEKPEKLRTSGDGFDLQDMDHGVDIEVASELGLGVMSDAVSHCMRPPEMDNSDLEGEHKGELKMNLVEHLDYELIPEEMWLRLVEWYGGGPAIPRKVICMGEDHQPQVELYPPLLLVVAAGESGQPLPQFSRRFFISRQTSLEEVLHMLADKLSRPVEKSRLWHRTKGERWRLVSQMNMMLDEFLEGKVWDAGTFLLETQRGEGEWPRDSLRDSSEAVAFSDTVSEHELKAHFEVGDRVEAQNGVTNQWTRGTVVDVIQCDHSTAPSQVKIHYDSTVYKCDEWISTFSDRLAPLDTHTTAHPATSSTSTGKAAEPEAPPPIRGATGLQNLGNTCFMNCTIQCLANTPLMREYFLSTQYLRDVNETGKAGCKGKLAEEFGSVMGELWSAKSVQLSPGNLKRTIDQFAPQFAGCEQHDAQELLAFFLDGLHEDLNRLSLPPGSSGRSNGPRKEAGPPKLFSRGKLRPNERMPGGSSGYREVSPKRRAAWKDRASPHPSDGLSGTPATEERKHMDTPLMTKEDTTEDYPLKNLEGLLADADHLEAPLEGTDSLGMSLDLPNDEANRLVHPTMLWSRPRPGGAFIDGEKGMHPGEDLNPSPEETLPSNPKVSSPGLGALGVDLGRPQVGEGADEHGDRMTSQQVSKSETTVECIDGKEVRREDTANANVEKENEETDALLELTEEFGDECISQDLPMSRLNECKAIQASAGNFQQPLWQWRQAEEEAGNKVSAERESTDMQEDKMEIVVNATGQSALQRSMGKDNDQARAASNPTSVADSRPQSKESGTNTSGTSTGTRPNSSGNAERSNRREKSDSKGPGTSRWWSFAWRRGRGALDLPKDGHANNSADEKDMYRTSPVPKEHEAATVQSHVEPPNANEQSKEESTSTIVTLGCSYPEHGDIDNHSATRDLPVTPEISETSREFTHLEELRAKLPAGTAVAAVRVSQCDISEDGTTGTFNESEDFVPELLSPTTAPNKGSAGRRSLNPFSRGWRRRKGDMMGDDPLSSPKRRPRTPPTMTPLHEEVPGITDKAYHCSSDGSCSADEGVEAPVTRATGPEVGSIPTPGSAPSRSFLPWKGKRNAQQDLRPRSEPGGIREASCDGGDEQAAQDPRAYSREGNRGGRAKDKESSWPSFLRRSKSRDGSTRRTRGPRAQGSTPPAATGDRGTDAPSHIPDEAEVSGMSDLEVRGERRDLSEPRTCSDGESGPEIGPRTRTGLGMFLRAPWKREPRGPSPGTALRNAAAKHRETDESEKHQIQANRLAEETPEVHESNRGMKDDIGDPEVPSESSPRVARDHLGVEANQAHNSTSGSKDGVEEPAVPSQNRASDESHGEEDEAAETDEDNLPDDEKAARQWERYRSRNRSLIVDVFEGQLRSQLTCCQCGNSSSTFEPFRYLSVPIPSNHVDRATLRVVFFPLPFAREEERPHLIRFSVTVPKSSTVQKVEKALSRLLPVPITSVLLAEVYRSRIHRYLETALPLSDVRAEDQLFAFEVLQTPQELVQYQEQHAPSRQRREKVEDIKKQPQPRVLLIQAMHRRVVDVCRSDGRTWAQRREVFGLPFVMSAASSWTYATLHDMLMLHARRFLKNQRRDRWDSVASADERQAQMPFLARIVNASGTACGACDKRNCTGCLLPKGNSRLRLRAGLLTGAVSTAKIYLALDWVDSGVYDQDYVDAVVDDPSVARASATDVDHDDAATDRSHHSSDGRAESKNGSVDKVPLSTCVDAFTQPEEMKTEFGNGVKCEKCNKVVDAVKKIEIWREPDVLIVHIKRFHFTGVHYEKLNTPVEVPCKELNLRPWIVGPSAGNMAPYELYAVACHWGGMSGGHYTSYCINHEGKEPVWLKYNDDVVNSVSLQQELDELSRQCYVLFYRKRAFSSSNLINYSSLL